MLGNSMYNKIDSRNPNRDSVEKARNYYIKSLNIFWERYSENNIDALYQEISQLFYKIKEFSRAAKYLQSCLSFYKNHID